MILQRATRSRQSFAGPVLCLLACVCSLFLTWPGTSTAQENGWQQTAGPPGAPVNILALNPDRPHILYAGTDVGLFQSFNGGETWQRVLSDAIEAIALAPDEPDRVYVGTHMGEVLVTKDAGKGWDSISRGLPSKIIWALAIDPANPERLYVGSDTVYVREGDKGWQARPLPTESSISALGIQANPERVYAGTTDGLWISADGGESWEKAELPQRNTASVTALAILPATAGRASAVILVGTERGLYRSTNNGLNWNYLGHGFGQGAVNCLAHVATDQDTVWAGLRDKGLAKSKDAGETWEHWQPVLPNGHDPSAIHALAIDPTHSRLVYLGTDSAVLLSADGGMTCRALSEGFIGTTIQALAAPSGKAECLVAATRFGLFRTTDKGATWKRGRAQTPIHALALAVDREGALYAGTWYSEIYRSTDLGATWELVHGNVASGAPILCLWSQLGTETGETDVLYAGTGGQGIHVSNDRGANWAPAGRALADHHVSALAYDPLTSRFYAGTRQGVFYTKGRAGTHEEETVALSWQQLAEIPTQEIMAIHAAPSAELCVATLDQLYCHDSQENVWKTLPGLGHGQVGDIQALRLLGQSRQNKGILLGTTRGIVASFDQGQTWQRLLSGSWVNALAIADDGPYDVYAGTRGSGVWRGSVSMPGRPAPWLLWSAGGLTLLVLAAGAWALLRKEQLLRAEVSPAEMLERNWPAWDQAVTQELRRSGHVTGKSLTQIPEDLRSSTLQLYIEVHPEQELTWNVEEAMLETPESRRIQALIGNWQTAQANLDDVSEFRNAASRITNQLCNFFGFNRIASRTYKHLHGFVVEGPTLRLRIPTQFPLIYLRQTEFTAQDIHDLRNIMDILDMTSYFALLFVFGETFLGPTNATELKTLTKTAAHDLIVLEFSDVFNAVTARHREQYLTRLLLQQVDLTVVSPYVTYGPVPENMFFGRDQEIKTITRTIQDQSFALVGGRKIGKTSVLAQVERILKQQPEATPFYLDCQAIGDEATFLESLRHRWQPLPKEKEECTFEEVANALLAEHSDQQLVFLLDEIDALLADDIQQGERLFRTFRALSQEGRCRFVFCGERILNAQLRNPTSPLFNFCQILRLGLLDRDTACQIIIEPMREMDIEIMEPDDLVDNVMDISSGHPNLIQYICQQLLVLINDREERRISLEELDELVRSTYFVEYFMDVVWGSATALEKLITLLMLDQPLVTVDKIQERLKTEFDLALGAEAIEEALQHLVLCTVLDRKREYYAFQALAFPDIVEMSQDVSELEVSLCRQLSDTDASAEELPDDDQQRPPAHTDKEGDSHA